MLDCLTAALSNAPCCEICIFMLTLMLSCWIYSIIRDRGVPPGPIGLPLLGYWPFLKNERCEEQLMEMKQKYGDVFSFRVTGQLYINLASFRTLREAHVTKSDCFTERPAENHILSYIFKDGVVFSNGEKWQTVRRFFLQQFRDRGLTLSKDNTVDAIEETMATLTQQLASRADQPANILRFLEQGINQVLRHTLLGPDTPIPEKELVKMQENYRFVNKIIRPTNIVLCGKLGKLIIPHLPNVKKAMKIHKNTKSLIHKWVDDHRRTFDESHVRDIIDSYFKERNLRRSKGDPTYEYFTDEALVANLLQFIGDAVINVSTFITFFLISLLDHPEEQEKIFEELTDVCGVDRNPTMADKNKLTYTNAFLQESQRYNNFVPIFPNQVCTRETTINGYRIPRGAVTLHNTYSIHNDPRVYEDPRTFNPSRFLAKDGKPKAESIITFGVGKRVCLGEGFVMMMTFLFCTTLVKNFRMSCHQSKTCYELIQTRELEINVVSRQ